MKKIIAFSFFLFSVSSYASFVINDPNDLLYTIDTYVAPPSFEEGFKLDDRVRHQTTKCKYTQNQDGSFISECDPFIDTEKYVFEKHADYVVVREAGNQGSVTVTREKYDSSNGNYLRSYLKGFRLLPNSSTVEVEIEEVAFESTSLNGSTIQAIRALYTIEICREQDDVQECFLMPEEMLLGRGMPALGQVIEHIPNRLVPDKTPVSKLLEFSRL